jgi:hypothetical protein
MVFGPNRRVSRRTARRTSRRVSRRQDLLRGGYSEPPPPTPAPAPAPVPVPAAAPAPQAEPDYADELRRLAQLKDQGLISEDEYSAKKRQILGI